MLAGALAGYAVAAETGNPWLGALAGAGRRRGCWRCVHACFVLARGANQLATGLVVLFLGLGLTSLFGAAYVGQAVAVLHAVGRPRAVDIPCIGEILFHHDPLTYLSLRWCPLLWWLIFRSRWGLLLRAAGERSEVLAAHGYHVGAGAVPARWSLGGMLAGIGGAHLSHRLRQRLVREHGRRAAASSPWPLVIFAARQPFKVHGRRLPVRRAPWPCRPRCRPAATAINQFALDACPTSSRSSCCVVLGRSGRLKSPRDSSGSSRALDPRRPSSRTTARATDHQTAIQKDTAARGTELELDAATRRALARRLMLVRTSPPVAPSAATTAARPGGLPSATDSSDAGDGTPGEGTEASASSSSARRTTSATTRRPTRAAQAVKDAFPDLEVLTAENVPEDDNAARVMEQHDRQGREDHLRHQLRPPRRRR